MASDQDNDSERIFKRYLAHRRFAEAFIEHMREEHGTTLTFDPAMLVIMVKSALIDIDRYKEFHLNMASDAANEVSPLSDSVKRAAYFVKWIRKLRPIQPLEHIGMKKNDGEPEHIEVSKKTAYEALANTGFAIFVGINHICDDEDISDDIFLSDEYWEDLIYIMTYREYSGDALILYYQTLQNMLSKSPMFEL